MEKRVPLARQKLAQHLNALFEERKLPNSFIASRCKTNTRVVEGWREGSLVPNTGEWADLLQYISRDFYIHTNLWREAKAEDDEERRNTHRALDRAQRIEVAPEIKVGTNVGEKIKEASTITPKLLSGTKRPTATMYQVGQTPRGFASDGRLLAPLRPDGSMTLEAQRARRRFVKGLLLQRPHIRVGGEDGIQAQLRARFGVGINPDIVQQLRKEIEINHTGASLQLPEEIPEKEKQEIITKTVPIEPNQKDLQAGVELILAAIPGLQQLIITTNDAGEASVEFVIRKTIGGSLKITKSAK